MPFHIKHCYKLFTAVLRVHQELSDLWQNMITHILFELWLITLLWIVSVFLTQTLA